MSFLTYLVLSVAVLGTQTAKLPQSFQKCDYKKAMECWPQAIENAMSQAIKPIKSIGLPSLEPLELPSLDIGAGSGPVNVDQHFRNVKFHGFSKMKVEKLDLNVAEKRFRVEVEFPEIKLVADYNLDGHILLLPIQGSGLSTVILKNLKANVIATLEVVEKNGKKYFNFLTTKTILNPEKVSFNFENLFNGDKVLGDNINKVLNENEKEVFDDVRPGYEGAFDKIILGLNQAVFSRVPLSEIFENYA